MKPTRGWMGAVLVIAALVAAAASVSAESAGAGRAAPEIAGGAWINSEPLTISGLRGRVVLIDFWTFG